MPWARGRAVSGGNAGVPACPTTMRQGSARCGDARRGWGLTGLFAVAISGLVLYLVWCVLWERSHPAGAAARGIRRGDSVARLKVIRGSGAPRPAGSRGRLARPDRRAWTIPSPVNRVAAAEGLVAVIQGVRMSDSDPGPVRDAVAGLIGPPPRPGARGPGQGVGVAPDDRDPLAGRAAEHRPGCDRAGDRRGGPRPRRRGPHGGRARARRAGRPALRRLPAPLPDRRHGGRVGSGPRRGLALPRPVPARAPPAAAGAGEIAGGDPTRVPTGVSQRPAAGPAR